MRWRIRGGGDAGGRDGGLSGAGSQDSGSSSSGTDSDNQSKTGMGRRRNAKRRAAANARHAAAGHGPEAEHTAGDHPGSATTHHDAAAGVGADDQRRETAISWQRFGRLQPTAASVAPILAPLGLPELASTRSLIHRPRPVPEVHAEPPIGTVVGIASAMPFDESAGEPGITSVLPFDAPAGRTVAETASASDRPAVATVPFDQPASAPPVGTASAPSSDDPATGPNRQGSVPEPAPLIITPVRATDSRPERPLTHVTPEYVGEPREPAVPYRAPAWLRAAMPSSEFGGVTTPLDAFASPMSWTAPTAPAASEPPAPPAQRTARRPGLGAPLRPAQIKALRERAANPEPDAEVEAQIPIAAEPVPEPAPRPRPIVQPLPSAQITPEPTPTLPDRFTATIPANLAATFERAHGFGVADVRVDRSPTAAAEAEQIGARAFTRGDLIVLPPEAGPPDAAAGLALLGHELTHVIQQRILGSAPPETSEFGLELEAAAQATESWIRAGAAGPPPPVIPEPPAPLWHQPAPAYRAAGPAMATHSATPSGADSRSEPGSRSVPLSGPRSRSLSAPAPRSTPASVQRAPMGMVDAPVRPANTPVTPIVVPTPGTSPEFPSLVHPAAASSSNPETSTPAYPRTEDELNQMIASGALDVYQSQQQPPAPEPPSYDRRQRRIELSVSLLDRANTQRAERGEQPLTELPPELAAMIEMHLDEEQVASMPAQNPDLLTGQPSNTAGPPGSSSSTGPGFLAGSRTGPGPRTPGPGPSPVLGMGFGTLPAAWGNDGAPPTPGSPPAGNGSGSEGSAPTPTPSAETPPPAPAPTPPQAAPAGIEPADLPDLNDEQLARLYERIKTRLRRELLVDRERTGQLMDFR
ncbi:MAG: DUF4157 domain-containing protein [Catenulispora sp.]